MFTQELSYEDSTTNQSANQYKEINVQTSCIHVRTCLCAYSIPELLHYHSA